MTLFSISEGIINNVFWRVPASCCGWHYIDEKRNALPVINVFEKYTLGSTGENDSPGSAYVDCVIL